MLTLWGSSNQVCDGITRRHFLQAGSLGPGLTLSELLRLQAKANTAPVRPKSVIMIYLWGGLSHHDTYDPKPKAPVEIRGEFKPIATSVPGIELSEQLPLQAKIAHRFSLLRGVKSFSREHNAVQEQVSGFAPDAKPLRPALGSVASFLRAQGVVPPFVNLARTAGNVVVSHDPSYLGSAHRPFVPGGGDLANLELRRLTTAQLEDRRRLLHSFDDVRRDVDAKQEMAAMDAFQARALNMVTSGQVREAFDVGREPAETRARYAAVPQLLLARRLVESGVSLVTTLLDPPAKLNNGSWDTHSDNFNLLRKGLPHLDAGLHTLLSDLQERGLDRDVLVVAWGEFGRTPRINKQAGRDHWPNANCVLLSGGGLRMGQVVGDSGPRGEQDATGRGFSPQTVAALVYHVLGIDPGATLPDHNGRPMYLVEDREQVKELL